MDFDKVLKSVIKLITTIITLILLNTIAHSFDLIRRRNVTFASHFYMLQSYIFHSFVNAVVMSSVKLSFFK